MLEYLVLFWILLTQVGDHLEEWPEFDES